MSVVNDAAQAAVARIIKDLTDRRGLRPTWELIDPDIQSEIQQRWATIIREEVAKHVTDG